MKKNYTVILCDDSSGWFVGRIVKMNPSKILVWEYGSEVWNNPKPGTFPPKSLLWLPKYYSKRKQKDLYKADPLSIQEAANQYKPVKIWQHKESALLWGNLVTDKNILHPKSWDLMQDIVAHSGQWDD
jgi:hypothetical protein